MCVCGAPIAPNTYSHKAGQSHTLCPDLCPVLRCILILHTKKCEKDPSLSPGRARGSPWSVGPAAQLVILACSIGVRATSAAVPSAEMKRTAKMDPVGAPKQRVRSTGALGL